ncbi:expressed unknown protein [Ectocarpus siliculosus]|uniref:Uncharacterized protein n=1 Tax=Ectocarpus siliculosus TaxID=2880 RepID=D7FWJ0_ECTSI|nr:expressed unknown protein [Ectocarpus siliculosus]|eukprot:CBJ32078.1 expressed unknown protein [Ectocarpus siliculosus]
MPCLFCILSPSFFSKRRFMTSPRQWSGDQLQHCCRNECGILVAHALNLVRGG